MSKILSKLSVPIIQAPMAGVSNSRFVIAACKAGILGSLGAGMLQPEAMCKEITIIKSAVGKLPFNVNLFVVDDMSSFRLDAPGNAQKLNWVKELYLQKGLDFQVPSTFAPKFADQLAALIEMKPPVASFTFGALSKEQVDELHSHGIMVIGTACNVDEAKIWAAAGADLITAQGTEAGGHRGNFTDLDFPGLPRAELVQDILHHVPGIPVIAAGNLTNGSAISDAIHNEGSIAVAVGTPFLVAEECPAPDYQKQALLQAGAHTSDPTTLTKAFTGRYARGLKNEFTSKFANKETFPYPVQNALTKSFRAAAAKNQDAQNQSIWAGTGVVNIKAGTVAEIVARLKSQMY